MPDFRPRHFGGPLLYASPNQNTPYENLPLDVVAQIGADGLGGVFGYFNHFLDWEGPVAEGSAAGWTLSGPTGTATIVLKDTRAGEIVLTNDGTGSAVATLQLGSASVGMNYIYAVGKRLWFGARLKFVTVATTELFFGVGTADTSPTVSGTLPSDGLFFHKTNTGTKVNFDARKDGTSTSKTTIGTTLVDDTYTILNMYVDPTGNVHLYQDGVELTASMIAAGTANLPGAADVMQFMIGIFTASMTLTLDWLYVYQEK